MPTNRWPDGFTITTRTDIETGSPALPDPIPIVTFEDTQIRNHSELAGRGITPVEAQVVDGLGDMISGYGPEADAMFASYGSNQTVVNAAGGVLTQEVIEDAATRAASQGGRITVGTVTGMYEAPTNGASSYTIYRGPWQNPSSLSSSSWMTLPPSDQRQQAVEEMSEIIRGFMKDE